MAEAQYARFEKMTNVELRAELKRRGCATSGNKKDLLAKLRLALEKEAEQPPDLLNDLPNSDPNSTPVIPIPQQLPVSPLAEPSNDPATSAEQGEQLTEAASNVKEVNAFVSKSQEHEEDDQSIEKLGDPTHLPAIDASSDSQNETAESKIKDIPTGEQQQQVNPTENLPTDEPRETTKENASLPATKEPPTVSIKFPVRSILNKLNLNLELLQTLITDVGLLSESVVSDELDSDQANESALEEFLPPDLMTIGELADQKQPTNRTVAIDESSPRKKPASFPVRVASFEGKNNGVATDDPIRIRAAAAANEPPSEILYIRGLTRPFSLMELKGLLSRYGTLVDGDFWLDKIKSQCFVAYNSVEDAENARQALDGCRWPSTNRKALAIRFARQDELQYSQTHDVPPNHLLAETTDRLVEEKTSSPAVEGPSNPLKEKQSGFLITEDEAFPEEDVEPVKANEPPTKGLDDYFRKTKAKPSIYWLPLTEEQIAERTRQQEERKAQRDEEQRKRASDENFRKRKRSVSPTKGDSKRH